MSAAPVAPTPTGRPVRRALMLAVVAVVLTIPAWMPRWEAERSHQGTELAVADSALRLWSAQKATDTKNPKASAWGDLVSAGVTTVIVGMHPISDAKNLGQVREIDAAAVTKAGLDAKIPAAGPGVWLASQPNDPSGSWRVIERMLRWRAAASQAPGAAGMPEKLTSTRVTTKTGWIGYLRFDSNAKWADLPAGFDRDRLRAVRAAKAQIVLAAPVRTPAPVGWLTRELDDAAGVAGTTRVLITSGAVTPDSASSTTLADSLARPGRSVLLSDLVEATDATDGGAGFAPYVEAAGGRVVRTHLVPLTAAAEENSLVQRGRRATKERGVRMLVVQAPPTAGRTVTSPADAGLRSLSATLPILTAWDADLPTSVGARSPAPVTGLASPMASVQPTLVARGLALLGGFVVLASATFAVTEVRVRWHKKIHRALPRPLAAAIFCAAALVGLFTWLRPVQLLDSALMLVVATAAATSAVLVAMTGQPPHPRLRDRLTALRWAGFLARYGVAIAVAVAGGWVLGALGADSHYLLLSDAFVGVKMLLLAPVVLVGVIGFGASRAELTYSGERFVIDLVRHRVMLGVLSLVVIGLIALYLIRSGNSGIATGPELWFRDWLDSSLFVRPRFKELLIGGPALLLALRWPGAIGRWVCATLAAIGTASIVDSFAHFHVPLAVSLLRTGYGAIGGLVIGFLVSAAIPAIVGPLRDALRTLEPVDDDTGSGAL